MACFYCVFVMASRHLGLRMFVILGADLVGWVFCSLVSVVVSGS